MLFIPLPPFTPQTSKSVAKLCHDELPDELARDVEDVGSCVSRDVSSMTSLFEASTPYAPVTTFSTAVLASRAEAVVMEPAALSKLATPDWTSASVLDWQLDVRDATKEVDIIATCPLFSPHALKACANACHAVLPDVWASDVEESGSCVSRVLTTAGSEASESKLWTCVK